MTEREKEIELCALKSEINLVESFRNRITTEACDRMILKLKKMIEELEGE